MSKQEQFEVFNKHLGYGCAERGAAWIVGVNQGGATPDLNTEIERRETYMKAPWEDSMTLEDCRFANRAKKIFSEFSEAPKLLLANLYPIPHRFKNPPFKDFGFDTEESYRKEVQNTRWRCLLSQHEELEPPVTICCGSTTWKEFRIAFGITSNSDKLNSGRAEVYVDKNRRFIFTGHFSWPWHFNNKDLDAVRLQLRQWNSTSLNNTHRQTGELL